MNRFTTTPMSFTAAASHASGMTVKTSDTYSSRRRSQLVCERMPEQTAVRARQGVSGRSGTSHVAIAECILA
ncbi:hypothetical protein ACLB1N_37100 [Escherichia coli]